MAENTIKDVKLKIGTENPFQSKLKDLPLNTLVGTTDPIQEGELDTSIITKLNKAENALPKPTNDTTGSAGQVLKKTANGSEWGDAPSGGGKLYRHELNVSGNMFSLYMVFYTPNSTLINTLDKIAGNSVTGRVNCIYEGASGIGSVVFNTQRFSVTGLIKSRSGNTVEYLDGVSVTPQEITDTVTEL